MFGSSSPSVSEGLLILGQRGDSLMFIMLEMSKNIATFFLKRKHGCLISANLVKKAAPSATVGAVPLTKALSLLLLLLTRREARGRACAPPPAGP